MTSTRGCVRGVELHAHVGGCVRPETLRELARERGFESKCDEVLERAFSCAAANSSPGETLKRCFDVFAIAHAACDTPSAIRRVCAECVEDFRADGCAYVELRTTPKDLVGANGEFKMTKRSYTEAACAGLADAGGLGDGSDGRCVARLVLSIDRGRDDTKEKAMETVQLAAEFMHRGVVGVDLSGAPHKGSWELYEDALKEARQLGLGIVLHCGEVVDTKDEQAKMIAFKPERLGHCVYTVRDDDLYGRLLASKIPVELCLTSNVMTRSCDSVSEHHAKKLLRDGAPICFCTDDTWVFNTTLRREYAIACDAFGLTMNDIRDMAIRAMNFALCDEHIKMKVIEHM